MEPSHQLNIGMLALTQENKFTTDKIFLGPWCGMSKWVTTPYSFTMYIEFSGYVAILA